MTGLALVLVALLGAAPSDDSCRAAHDLRAGQPAPCAGVLVPLTVSDECVSLKVSVVPRLELKLERLAELRRIDGVAAAGRLSACNEECARLRTALQSVTAPPVRPWYEATGFVAVMGVAAGLVVGIVGTWAVMDR